LCTFLSKIKQEIKMTVTVQRSERLLVCQVFRTAEAVQLEVPAGVPVAEVKLAVARIYQELAQMPEEAEERAVEYNPGEVAALAGRIDKLMKQLEGIQTPLNSPL
jgi:predicted metal-dependent hydrolase